MKTIRHRNRNALLAAAFAATSVGALSSNNAHAYISIIDDSGVLYLFADNDEGESLRLWASGSSSSTFYLFAEGNLAASYAMDDYDEVVIVGSAGDDSLRCSLPIKCTLYGEGGDDRISGDPLYMDGTQQYPVTEFFGGDDNDYILGAGGAELNGDDGNDELTCNSSTPCTVYGGDGDDEINGHGGDDWLYGGPGNDVIEGKHGTDHIFGEDGDDTLSGEFGGTLDLRPDVINGGDGIDTIAGLGASDIVTEVENL